jgi:hypothetical protein
MGVFLTGAALDTLGFGLWGFVRPGDLLALLDAASTPDALFMLRSLAALHTAHVTAFVLLVLPAVRSAGLLVGPLLDRTLLIGLWAWLLGTDRVRLAPAVLRLLLTHDALWLVVLLGCWLGWSLREKSP